MWWSWLGELEMGGGRERGQAARGELIKVSWRPGLGARPDGDGTAWTAWRP